MLSFGHGSEPYIPYRPLTPVRSRELSFSDSPPNVCSERHAQTSDTPAKSAKEIVVKPEDTLPTPRPSFDNNRREKLLAEVRDLHRKVISDPLKEVSLADVDEEEFEWLRKKGEAGEIAGWESIRFAGEYLRIYLDSTKCNLGLTIWIVS
jgi:hypothetical protein